MQESFNRRDRKTTGGAAGIPNAPKIIVLPGKTPKCMILYTLEANPVGHGATAKTAEFCQFRKIFPRSGL
jgi:hypothetical protein